MTGHRRRSALVVLALCLAAGAAVVSGHAASLQVDSARLDAYGAAQPAPTTTSSTAPSDTTAPALTTLEMFDDDADGFVDRVLATFNEALAPYTAGNTPWTLANVPSGGSLLSVSVPTGGTTATLTLTEGTNPALRTTAVGSFTVKLDPSATGIRDAAGNQSSFLPAAPTDRAKPIPLSLDIPNGGAAGNNNKATQGDQVIVVWSERLLASTICTTGLSDTATATVTGNLNNGNSVSLSNGASGANDALTAAFNCGASGTFRFGSVDLGSAAYTTDQNSFGANAAAGRSSVEWNPSTATIRITLGTQQGPGTPAVVGTAVAATYAPDAGLTDPAGNTATGTVSKTDTHF